MQGDLFQTLFDAVPFGVYIVDPDDYSIVYMNDHFRPLLEGAVQPLLCHRVFYGQDRVCEHCRIDPLLSTQKEGQTLRYEVFNEMDNRWYQIQDRLIRWPDGRLLKCAVAMDIGDLKATQNRLSEVHAELAIKNRDLKVLSEMDTLTRLANRGRMDGLLRAELDRIKRYGGTFSVLMIDADHFKRVNDTYGHATGDTVLQSIAATLSEAIRTSDSAARWGGEEFLILAPQIGDKQAAELAQRLCEGVRSAPYPYGLKQTISVGVATYRSGESIERLLARADEQLYVAKASGRDRVESAAAHPKKGV